MKSSLYLLILLLAVSLSACTGMSTREQSTLSGGAIGAAGGALIGGVTGGRPAVGAALGGAAGALSGYILGDPDRRPRKRR